HIPTWGWVAGGAFALAGGIFVFSKMSSGGGTVTPAIPSTGVPSIPGSANASGNPAQTSDLTAAVAQLESDINKSQQAGSAGAATNVSQLESDLTALQTALSNAGSANTSTITDAISAMQAALTQLENQNATNITSLSASDQAAMAALTSQLSSMLSSAISQMQTQITALKPQMSSISSVADYMSYFGKTLAGNGFFNIYQRDKGGNFTGFLNNNWTAAMNIWIQSLKEQYPGLVNVPEASLENAFYYMFVQGSTSSQFLNGPSGAAAQVKYLNNLFAQLSQQGYFKYNG
ncbi:MAG: hypothetical protein ACREHG_00745, partial [Candidatus Saccharimonadales bacterium]